jgi:hypothetical protein
MSRAALAVEPAARAAAEKCVALPLRKAVGADPEYGHLATAIGVIKVGDNFYVGARGSAGAELGDLEIGTEDQAPAGYLVHTVESNRAEANREFARRLAAIR